MYCISSESNTLCSRVYAYMCCRYRTVLHCTFSASCTYCPSSKSDDIFPSRSADGPTKAQALMNATFIATISTSVTSSSLTAFSFLTPSRPATSPFFPMQPRPSRTASLARRYRSPLCGPKAAAADLAAARQVQGNMPIPCI